MAVDYIPSMGDYNTLQPFRYWCQKVLPLVYDDSLSYYELLCKVVDYLNKTMEDVETLHNDVDALADAYKQLQDYVNNYFDNLDVQTEINNKLDTMVTDGTFDTLLAPYMAHYQNELNVMKSRIDVLEANYDAGGTTADAELADIRVAYNAEVYDSAGDSVRAITGRNAKEILNINAKTDMTNYVDSLGFTHQKLNNDGTASDNDDWITTDYIPVDSQVWYVTEIPNWAQDYTLLRATYDSSKNFIAYVTINASPSPRDYVPPFGTAYVKFSVSKTAYDVGFKFRKKYNEFDNIDTREDGVDRNIENINSELDTTDYFLKYGVVLGKLNSSGVLTDNTSFRTSDFIPVESGAWYVTGSYENLEGFTLWRATYDANKDFIEYVQIAHDSNDRIFVPPLGTAYVRYTVSSGVYNSGFYFKKLNTTIDSIKNVVLPDAQIYHYTGNAIDIVNHNSYACYKFLNTITAPAGKTAQGFAVYNDKLFQFFDSDLCIVYDIKESGRQIGQFALTCGHGNSAVFSSEFYDNSDDFPLLYISDINGNVYVTRITTSSATTVKTLYFNPATFGANPQLALGDGDYGYVVGNISGTDYLTSAKISVCDMSNLTQNVDDSYTPAVLDTFTLSMTGDYPILQGVNYLNGRLYISSGSFAVSVLSRIYVIDLTGKTITNVISDFPDALSVGELEDIVFIANPSNGKYDILAHVRTIGYYRLIF